MPLCSQSKEHLLRDGVDPELDEYRGLATSGKDFLIANPKREIEQYGDHFFKNCI